jgi:polyferredoxin
VIHARQPLYVLQSDGSIQNRYTLKVLNKTSRDRRVQVRVEGPEGIRLSGAEQGFDARHGQVTPRTVFVRLPPQALSSESVPITFKLNTQGTEQPFSASRSSIFIGPAR